jgi:hypothetical protein
VTIFQWNDWNRDHIDEHGVLPEEAEDVVRGAKAPYPEDAGEGKLLVWGQGPEGRYLQVIFRLLEDEEVEADLLSLAERLAFSEGRAEVAYIIHARDLEEPEKRQFRRRRR